MKASGIATSRELYVAFAFAAADLLLEIDETGAVIFAVGASMVLTGRPARALAGVAVADIFVPQDRERVDRALLRMDEGERVRLMLLHTPGTAGHAPKPVALAGYRHPAKPGGRLLALTHAGALDVPEEKRGPVSRLLGRDDFSVVAQRMMEEGSLGDDSDTAYHLTMVELPAVERVRASAGPVKADEFVAQLGETLKSVSMGGDCAGDLGDNRYGVIHSAALPPARIEAALGGLVAAFLPDHGAEPIKSVTLALDAAGISSEEATNALLYSLNRFSQGEAISLSTLAKDVRTSLSNTVGQMREIKEVIDQGRFDLVFQPIVDMWSDHVHHFECLVRFPDQGSPFETVTFAENVGIVGTLDMAILSRAIGFMRSPAGAHQALRFAVNLSGRSLSHAPTARRLLATMARCPDLKGRLMFELTESAEVTDLPAVNAILQTLRRAGFAVCLDDFGAGSAAFHYLRALQVDHVKIDGAYIRELSGSAEPTPYLRAIAQLCQDLKIGTIAEYVETRAIVNLLKPLKVQLAQGYLYGKPMQPAAVDGDPVQGWATNNLFWHNGVLTFRNQAPNARPVRFPTFGG